MILVFLFASYTGIILLIAVSWSSLYNFLPVALAGILMSFPGCFVLLCCGDNDRFPKFLAMKNQSFSMVSKAVVAFPDRSIAVSVIMVPAIPEKTLFKTKIFTSVKMPEVIKLSGLWQEKKRAPFWNAPFVTDG